MKALLISFIVLVLLLIFFHTRGTISHDEGYILQSSLKLYEGQIPYRDFHFVYTPGSIFLTALSFLIFSPSILSSRILMIIISLLSSLLVYKTTLLATKNKLYGFLATLTYIAWGPTHVNFAWPVMFCIPVGLALCFFLLKFISNQKDRYLFFAGSSTFIMFLFKQNFGVAAILASIIFFLCYKNSRKLNSILSFLYGFVWSAILFAFYLLSTKSLVSFINDMYLFTFWRIIIQEDLNTKFFYYDTFVKSVGRFFIYLLPLITSVATIIIILLRKRYYLLFIPFFIFAFYFLGIRPTTDYIHLTPLLSLIGISMVLFLRFNTSSALRFGTFFLILIIIALGFQTALFKGYYRWDEPLINHNVFYKHSRVNIFVSNKTNNDLSKFLSVINHNSVKDDYILINSYNPLYYFVSNRSEPTKHNYLTHDVNSTLYDYSVIVALSQKKIPLVFIPKNSRESINIYIKTHYFYIDSFGDFEAYGQNR